MRVKPRMVSLHFKTELERFPILSTDSITSCNMEFTSDFFLKCPGQGLKENGTILFDIS